ncbi:hypothetical protein HQO90_12905 [Rhodococcus fascians]|nr:hypothetical protein [Rhodococcus fascians]MBY4058103.1 hypothetical protein [Rhodococcus fascians]MBY4069746.1 hypothetical protein [Rhodococcus fascians]
MTSADGPLLVCITGGDASGKSTQIDAVRDILTARGVSVAIASIWDGMQDARIAPSLPFSSRNAVHDYLRIVGAAARSHFLFHALHVAMDCALSAVPDVLLLNAYWYKYYATEVAYGGDAAVLRASTVGFTEPDLVCYLRTSVHTAVQRRVDPSGYESAYGDADSFYRLQQTSRLVLEELSAELGWISLDAEICERELTARIVYTIDQALAVR